MKQTPSILARLRHRAAAAWFGLARDLRLRWKNHLGTLLMVVGVFVAVQAWQTRDVPSGMAPDLRLTLLQPDGRSTDTTLAAWRQAHPGQPVGVYVWAEWCPICKTMEGSVTALSQDQPLLTMAMQSGSPGAVARVLQQRQLPWQTAVDTRGDAARALGFRSVPSFVVVDANGHLRGASVGYTSEAGMRLRLWWARLRG